MPNLASDLWCMPGHARRENQIVYCKTHTNLSNNIDKIEKGRQLTVPDQVDAKPYRKNVNTKYRP
jgi:hypothetical protein